MPKFESVPYRSNLATELKDLPKSERIKTLDAASRTPDYIVARDETLERRAKFREKEEHQKKETELVFEVAELNSSLKKDVAEIHALLTAYFRGYSDDIFQVDIPESMGHIDEQITNLGGITSTPVSYTHLTLPTILRV